MLSFRSCPERGRSEHHAGINVTYRRTKLLFQKPKRRGCTNSTRSPSNTQLHAPQDMRGRLYQRAVGSCRRYHTNKHAISWNSAGNFREKTAVAVTVRIAPHLAVAESNVSEPVSECTPKASSVASASSICKPRS